MSKNSKQVGDAVAFQNGYGAIIPGVVESVERRLVVGPRGGSKRVTFYGVRVPVKVTAEQRAQGYSETALFEVGASSLVEGV